MKRVVTLACRAMATRFELVLVGEDEARLRAAGEEAMEEVQRVERELSPFRPESQIARVNRAAGGELTRVSPEVFKVLLEVDRLSRLTHGAFDVTVGPLLKAWGFRGEGGRVPEGEELKTVLGAVGADAVERIEESFSVRLRDPGGSIDLGAIGKGYALDRAKEVLLEAGVSSFLVHGGTSTVVACGRDAEDEVWRVGIARAGLERNGFPGDGGEEPLGWVALDGEALSVSAIWGRGMVVDGRYYGHVMDPRTGWPVAGAELAAVVMDSAMASDALSTALLVDGRGVCGVLEEAFPGARYLVVESGEAGARVVTEKGISVRE